LKVEQAGIPPILSCALAVTGYRVDVHAIQKALGTSSQQRSDLGTIKLGPDAGKQQWSLTTTERHTMDLNSVVDELLGCFSGNLRAAGVMFDKEQLTCTVAVTVHVRSWSRPAIYISAEVLRKIAELGAEFEVDWYDACDYDK
jgi:hypothetical protein